MLRAILITGLACAMLGAAMSQASPPLIQPGAPGAPSRTLSADESVALSRTGYVAADTRFMQHMIVHHQQAVDMVALIEARTSHDGVTRIGRRISLTQQGEMAQMRGWLDARDEPLIDGDLRPGHAHSALAEHAGHGDHAMAATPFGPGEHSGHGDNSEHGDNSGHGDHSGHAGAGMHGDHGAMAGADPYTTPLMHGMLSPAQMDALAEARGAAFDRLFLDGMIHHHQGAVDMVSALLSQPGAGEDTALSEFLTHVVADQSAEILRMRNMRSAMDADHPHEGHP
jgi:uncharacterized protein (DUF305 family)